MLYNDISWQLLPLELGFGSGQTYWRRLGRWHEAGVFEKLHRILLAELHAAGAQDWTPDLRACLPHPRKKRGRGHRSSPVDRGKTGSKHHLICDRKGTPLEVITTAANATMSPRPWSWSTASHPWPASPDGRAADPMRIRVGSDLARR
ncbi:transposase [Streptomyces griseosporeus]|uniref:transposase n=1 Tax=Streptomyces griseosporeus TaxID=1910 RepID=UPI00167C4FFA|nr:transposase [Streptomyces griseosporeus]GHF36134.1 hypothetical protein GCM10018783_00500 [Streptomyces griseosporeus]